MSRAHTCSLAEDLLLPTVECASQEAEVPAWDQGPQGDPKIPKNY